MDTQSYPPALAELHARPCAMPLGPGVPERAVAAAIRGFDLPVARDRAMVEACRAGLWLRFNHLDESHAVSQEIAEAEGAFWHAIMHRREPDPANSKYWWRRVGSHPVLEQLAAQTPALGYEYRSPFDFVDDCERSRGRGSAEEATAIRVQLLEWQLLFDWCFRSAFAAR